jgi:hypothetical protein
MSNRQFWSYLGLEFIYKTTFGKIFYKTACDFNEHPNNNYLKFMDFDKFLQFIGIFTKLFKDKEKTRTLRKKFVYRLFDNDNNEEIDKLEFRNFINAFIEMILICNFQNESIKKKINDIIKDPNMNMQIIEEALDKYVDDVFMEVSFDGNVMTYIEWDNWISKVDGVEEILNFCQNENKDKK